MTIVVMQPYIFPYIGYFQLLAVANRFVVYDDVNFIKGGWINRNQLLVGGNKWLFTIPLESPSPNRKICDIKLNSSPIWRKKLLQTIKQNYQRAPQFEVVWPILSEILNCNTQSNSTMADLVRSSLYILLDFLQLPVELVPSSVIYHNEHLRSQERVLDICRQEQATHYVNAQGGRHLYDKKIFAANGVDLGFLIPTLQPYSQGKGEFVPGLSIIDVLMYNSISEIGGLLSAYKIE